MQVRLDPEQQAARPQIINDQRLTFQGKEPPPGGYSLVQFSPIIHQRGVRQAVCFGQCGRERVEGWCHRGQAGASVQGDLCAQYQPTGALGKRQKGERWVEAGSAQRIARQPAHDAVLAGQAAVQGSFGQEETYRGLFSLLHGFNHEVAGVGVSGEGNHAQ